MSRRLGGLALRLSSQHSSETPATVGGDMFGYRIIMTLIS